MLKNTKQLSLIFLFTALFSLPCLGNLSYVITETVLGVEITGTGSVNTAGLTEIQTPSENPLSGGFINEYHDALAVGIGAIDFFDAVGFSGSGAFGPGPGDGFTGRFATSGAGDPFGFDLFFLSIVVPEDYVSGTELFGSGFYEGETLASLQLTPGSYSWADDGGNNTIDLTIVPEPSAYAVWFMLGTLCMLCMKRRERRQ